MEKISKKTLVILIIAVLLFVSSVVFFGIKKLPSLLKPSVYYRTYTKEDGWSKWSKNGETSGNKHDITAIQIKLKGKGTISYNALNEYDFDKVNNFKKNNEVSGDKKTPVKYIFISGDEKFNKKYTIKYHATIDSSKWKEYDHDGTACFINDKKTGKPVPIKYIQIIVERREK